MDRTPTSRGRSAVLTAAIGGLVVGLIAGAGVMSAVSGDDASAADLAPRATVDVPIERRTLEVTESLTGELVTASSEDVFTSGSGTLTAPAIVGTSLERGSVVARIDDQPVSVLYGTLPAWRAFTTDMDDGPDIAQLELNLIALGFDPDGIEVDNEFTSATAAGIEAWETEIGISDPDGVIDAGEVVFISGPAQVSEAVAAGTRLSAGDSIATVQPDASSGLKLTFSVTEEADRYRPGAAVMIIAGDGSEIPATVWSLERDATEAAGGATAGQATATSFTVTALPEEGSELSAGPVDVDVATERAEDVLAVPTRSLVAVVEGGQAVELSEGNQLVAVEIGVFADGWVEVTGAGLAEGVNVVAPA